MLLVCTYQGCRYNAVLLERRKIYQLFERRRNYTRLTCAVLLYASFYEVIDKKPIDVER